MTNTRHGVATPITKGRVSLKKAVNLRRFVPGMPANSLRNEKGHQRQSRQDELNQSEDTGDLVDQVGEEGDKDQLNPPVIKAV